MTNLFLAGLWDIIVLRKKGKKRNMSTFSKMLMRSLYRVENNVRGKWKNLHIEDESGGQSNTLDPSLTTFYNNFFWRAINGMCYISSLYVHCIFLVKVYACV